MPQHARGAVVGACTQRTHVLEVHAACLQVVEEEAARVEHGVAERAQAFEALATDHVQRFGELQRQWPLERLLSQLVGVREVGEQRHQVVLGGWRGENLALLQCQAERLTKETPKIDFGGDSRIILAVSHRCLQFPQERLFGQMPATG